MVEKDIPTEKQLERGLTLLFQKTRGFIAEFIGSAIVCGVCVSYQNGPLPGPLVMGFTFTMMLWMFFPVSGCNINPVVTLMIVCTRRMPLIDGLIHIAAQFSGALAGSWLGMMLLPAGFTGTSVGMTTINPTVTLGQAVGLEIGATALLMILILSTLDELHTASWNPSRVANFPFIFGITITLLGTLLGELTGCSLNPARSLGPAVLNKNFKDLWVYFIGPLLGAFIGTMLYEFILAEGVCTLRIKLWFTGQEFERNKDYRIVDKEKLTSIH